MTSFDTNIYHCYIVNYLNARVLLRRMNVVTVENGYAYKHVTLVPLLYSLGIPVGRSKHIGVTLDDAPLTEIALPIPVLARPNLNVPTALRPLQTSYTCGTLTIMPLDMLCDTTSRAEIASLCDDEMVNVYVDAQHRGWVLPGKIVENYSLKNTPVPTRKIQLDISGAAETHIGVGPNSRLVFERHLISSAQNKMYNAFWKTP